MNSSFLENLTQEVFNMFPFQMSKWKDQPQPHRTVCGEGLEGFVD